MALDPNRWTLKTTEAFSAATESAKAVSNPEVTPDHLLIALLGQHEGIVLPILHKVGVDPISVRNRAADSVADLTSSYGSEASISSELGQVLEAAERARVDLDDEYLSTEHLLLALADRVDVDAKVLLAALREVRGSHRVREGRRARVPIGVRARLCVRPGPTARQSGGACNGVELQHLGGQSTRPCLLGRH